MEMIKASINPVIYTLFSKKRRPDSLISINWKDFISCLLFITKKCFSFAL